MRVAERLAIPGLPEVVLAGPVMEGVCRTGDALVLRGEGGDIASTCRGLELIRWGADRGDWVSLRVADVTLEDLATVTEVLAPGAG